MAKKILVIGSSNMDLLLSMNRVPAPGETLLDDGGAVYLPGGKGANAAVAFAKLGADCVFCTKLGADAHGKQLYDYYKSVGLDVSMIKVDRTAATGLAAVMREANGQNRIIVYPGANALLSAENIAEAFSVRPDAVFLGFEIPFSTVLAAAQMAAAKGIPIFVDAAPADKKYPLESLPKMEVFSPNETETAEYTGITPTGAESCLRAGLALLRRVKCKYLVIKLGARGAFVYDGVHFRMVPAFRPEKVVDTTAAGDAFTAAMTLAYVRGNNVFDSVRFGCAAGALTVSRKGASVSIPSSEEVADLLSKNPL